MQKVLTAAQMREVDRLTTERYGIPSIILMENAAHAVARVITEKLGGSVKNRRVVLLCGLGNNGGDGAALARILWRQGASCFVYLSGKVSQSKGNSRTNFEAVKAICEKREIPGPNENCLSVDEMSEANVDKFISQWRNMKFDVFVDALLGTGLSGTLRPPYDKLVRAMQSRRSRPFDYLVSVDIPSGIDSDLNSDPLDQTNADATVTFTAPKLGNLLPPASYFNGELTVANIGSPQELIDEQPSQLFLADGDDIARWMKKSEFSKSSYKNKRGHALMIAGSRDYTGAAVLCGDAAIRSGVGLVTLAVPESSRDSVVARVSPEVMVRGIAETENGSASEKAFDEITEFSKNVDVIAVGSGLSSKEDETKRFIKRIVDERKMPIVIDADGLTALSPWHEVMQTADRVGSPHVRKGSTVQKPARPQGRNQDVDSYALAHARASAKNDELPPLILTPHEGEFRKLLGLEKEEFEGIIKDRVKAVRDFATEHKVILVLKGERNLIGAPNGNVVVNPSGNPGLGKAGNGDTLTGIITGFVAQAVQMKIDIFETVVAAVYVAGMAGDIAEKKFGKRVMTASDTRECLAEVFAQFEASSS